LETKWLCTRLCNELLLAPNELDFSYENYLKEKIEVNDCDSVDNYLSFFEENGFIEMEIKEKTKTYFKAKK